MPLFATAMKLVEVLHCPTAGRNPIVVNSKKKEWLTEKKEEEGAKKKDNNKRKPLGLLASDKCAILVINN